MANASAADSSASLCRPRLRKVTAVFMSEVPGPVEICPAGSLPMFDKSRELRRKSKAPPQVVQRHQAWRHSYSATTRDPVRIPVDHARVPGRLLASAICPIRSSPISGRVADKNQLQSPRGVDFPVELFLS